MLTDVFGRFVVHAEREQYDCQWTVAHSHEHCRLLLYILSCSWYRFVVDKHGLDMLKIRMMLIGSNAVWWWKIIKSGGNCPTQIHLESVDYNSVCVCVFCVFFSSLGCSVFSCWQQRMQVIDFKKLVSKMTKCVCWWDFNLLSYLLTYLLAWPFRYCS